MGRVLFGFIAFVFCCIIVTIINNLIENREIKKKKCEFNQIILVFDKTNFPELIEKTPLIALDLMNSILIELSKFANIEDKVFKSHLTRISLLNKIDTNYHPFFIGKSKHNKGFYVYNKAYDGKIRYYGGRDSFVYTTLPCFYYETDEEAFNWLTHILYEQKIKSLQEFLHTTEENVMFDV